MDVGCIVKWYGIIDKIAFWDGKIGWDGMGKPVGDALRDIVKWCVVCYKVGVLDAKC